MHNYTIFFSSMVQNSGSWNVRALAGSLFTKLNWAVEPQKPLASAEISVSMYIREGCKKSKWKFKMAFAMKGGRGRDRSRVPHTYSENDFF